MNKRGFQLLECLIGCLLLSILAGIGIGTLSRVKEWYRLHLGARTFVTEITSVRSTAVSRNLSLSVHVAPDGEAYGWATRGSESTVWRKLPSGVSFTGAPQNPVTFFSRGNAAPAGSYLLQNSWGRVKVVVSPGGRTRWETFE